MTEPNISYKNEKEADVILNPEIYPLDVIYGAAHIMTDKAYFLLNGDPKKEVVISITRKSEAQDIKTLAGDFVNELLNFTVNKTKSRESLEFRNIVLEKLSSANIK
jgi:His-Xaa-Ser system protein HxsD